MKLPTILLYSGETYLKKVSLSLHLIVTSTFFFISYKFVFLIFIKNYIPLYIFGNKINKN